MADFSADLWIRSPAIAGKREAGGGLNNSMAKLQSASDEITQIETLLGALVKGSGTDLADRLNARLSPCGILRGQIVQLRGPNAPGDSLFSISRWSQGGTVFWTLDQDGPFTNTNPTITFPTAYTLEPTVVIAQYTVEDSSSRTLGEVQVETDSISTTGFRVFCRRFSESTGAWENAGTAGTNYYVTYIALGGG